MCLAVPGRVVEVNPSEFWAVVETFGVSRLVKTQLVGQLVVGEYVMVHAGYALEKLDLEAAQEQLRLWEELLRHES